MVDRDRGDRVVAPRDLTRRGRVIIRGRRAEEIIDIGDINRGELIRPLADPSVLIIRPEDMVILRVSWRGLYLQKQEGKPARLVRRPGNAHLIVEFPRQHLLEEAYFEEAEGLQATQNPSDPEGAAVAQPPGEDPIPPPIPALISEPSRLVFEVPVGSGSIPFTSAGILEAMGRLPLAVASNALPRRHPIFYLAVSAGALTASTIAFPNTTTTERIINATRLRRAVRAPNPLTAAIDPSISGMMRRGLITPARRSGATVESVEAEPLLPGLLREILLGIRRVRPKPGPPSDLDTAIESPYRLIISPSRLGGWAHAPEAVTHAQRTELWHTRLGVASEDDAGNPTVDERSSWQRIVRAIWARGANLDASTIPSAYTPAPPLGTFPFRPSLDDFDRHQLVHLSSNWTITSQQGRYTPEPVDVERLMLTSMGSWMRTAGHWEPPPILSVEEWIHRATFGRDHFVRVVYRGYLLPFGHRASLIKITERKFHPTKPGNPAYLRQRMYIIVKEPVKNFGSSNWTYGPSDYATKRAMPFQSVRILNLQTPDLTDPDKSKVISDAKAFWPHVAGSPFLFKVEATDVVGRVSHFAMPMIWYDQTKQTTKSKLKPIVDAYNGPQHPGINGDPNDVALQGQRIAYTQPKSGDDTVFETGSIVFEAQIPNQTFGKLPDDAPRFHPTLATADLAIPAVRQLAGTAELSTVRFADAFLLHDLGTAGNKGELLFWNAGSQAVSVKFGNQSDRSGGLATPNLDIAGISRLAGPVSGSNATKLAAGTFDPGNFFSGLDAKLFGVIDLAAVLKEVPFFSDVAKIPGFISKQVNQIEALLDDLEQLKKAIASTGNSGTALINAADGVADAIADRLTGQPADVGDALTTLAGDLTIFLGAVDGIGLPALEVKRIKNLAARIQSMLATAAQVLLLLDDLLDGLELPTTVRTRFEWKPTLDPWPNASKPIFDPTQPLILAVEAAASFDTGATELSVLASLRSFKLRLINPAQFIVLHFGRLEFRLTAGEKPEIDVVLDDVEFVGVLSFVEVLKDLIPLDGFSDPPAVDVDASGITASYTLGLPNVSVGVFALENLSIGAGFAIPFVGDPLSVWFAFCEKENPALVSVSLFAGGFFFKVALDPSGVKLLEAAIEFGANVSMDFGVASGGVSAMAGLYFKMEADEAKLAGYFRVRGHVRALGIIGVSIELYLELAYEPSSGKCVGRASLKISIELFLFEVSITISCEKKFAGSGADPTFAQTFAPYELTPGDPTTVVKPWEEYCRAYA